MSTESAKTPATRLRASDGEREEFATIVREAVGEGRLDIAEGDTRLAAVYAAKYRDELAPLVTDLPAGQRAAQIAAQAAAPRGGGRGVPGSGWSDQGQSGPWGPGPWGRGGPGSEHRHGGWEHGGRGLRRGYGGGLAGAFAHTGFVVVVAGLLTLLWLISATHFFWPAIPLFFLVMGLGRHWRWATWRRQARADRD